MPPPSLSTTTMRRSASRCRSAVSAPASWTKAMSPTHDDRRRAGLQRDAERRRHDAVDAVGAAVGVGRRRAAPPNHSRSRIGIDAATTTVRAGGAVAGDEAGDGRLAQRRLRAEDPVDGGRRASSAAADPPAAPAGVADAARARRRAAGSTAASRLAATRWSGSIVPGSADLHDGRAATRRPTGRAPSTTPAGRARTTTSGRSAAKPAWRSSGVERRRSRRARRGAETRRRRAAASPSPSTNASTTSRGRRRRRRRARARGRGAAGRRARRAPRRRRRAAPATDDAPARRQRAGRRRRAARGTAG